MEAEVSVNWANNIHPCYEIENFSYVLTSSPSTTCVLLYIFLGLLSVTTICGNLLIIFSIIYFKQLHTPTNSLILSLAVADLLVGVLVFPFSMAFSLSSCLYYEHLFCKVRSSFDVTISMSSILNLCCIAIDRYYAVCHPLRYATKINRSVVVVMIVVSWSASATVATGLVIAGLKLDGCKEMCWMDVVLATMMGIVFGFYVPLIIMLCIYLKIFLVAQRQARSIQSTTYHRGVHCTAAVSKLERKSTKTLATVMGVFIMCWIPFFICMTFNTVSIYTVSASVIETLNWLALLNSMLNPFIYAFFYKCFRSAFRIIISGKTFRGNFTNYKLH